MKTQEKHEFKSEIKQLLHIMIHSLYSNKEIFVRELISNASDAIDKLRFKSITSEEIHKNFSNGCITIYINKEKNTLTISDNGIGMTRQEIIDNLGTIAKSGTKDFINSLMNDKKTDNQLIGQFGVGFYSSFIVSEKVLVRTRAATNLSEEGIQWESSGQGEYTIHNIVKKEQGTEIILYLKKEEKEFLDIWKIKNIIKKYSDHISVPIKIFNFDEQKKTGTWEQINKATALWTLNKTEIKIEEYQEFYKHITNDFNKPLIWSHNHVEGNQEYISLLYIPEKSAWDLWNRENKHGLKLYVKRIFIMDDASQFLPNYLRFVRGLIDSNDLPLNISREILQDNHIIQKLRRSLTKRVLNMLTTLATNDPEKYKIFWNQFGLVLKEGPAEDSINKNEIANLLRFSSLNSNNSEQNMSLVDYIQNMKTEQDKIYYITSDSYAAASSSPHLEFFKKHNINVLLLFDRIDEWMMNYITEFQGKKFQSISKDDESLNKLVKKNNQIDKNVEENINDFIKKVKTILKDQVKDVRITYRLIDTPSIVLTDTNEMTTQMAKLFSAAGQNIPPIKYIFEINPNHILIKKIMNVNDSIIFNEWIQLLLEQALLAEKGNLDNPNQFINRINLLLSH
ncbi:molecular chaperone HtpG [Buchnera aphidicola (Formosaphis micheliae)]|uniref:molecular chaperone HtpG n=1 Tax=Buchnera aphidicola TaxID=9 RepID=UPI0031CC62A3